MGEDREGPPLTLQVRRQPPLTRLEHLGESRGRGVTAAADIEAFQVLLTVPCDIAVLYTPMHLTHCHLCFRAVRAASDRHSDDLAGASPYVCPDCESFVLCAACTAAAPSASPDDAATGAESVASRITAHATACGWYTQLPLDVRKGDTDYLRFALEFCARVQHGDSELNGRVMDLMPSSSDVEFCTGFARKVVSTFAGAGLTAVTADMLRDVLLRTRCNSLGYPFDERETLGWSLQRELCMLNHSCVPNCAMRRAGASGPAERGREGWIELVSLVPIKAGEECVISYVDVETYATQPVERREVLQRQYGFVCRCPRCTAQLP